jgi:hypothetical protein
VSNFYSSQSLKTNIEINTIKINTVRSCKAIESQQLRPYLNSTQHTLKDYTVSAKVRRIFGHLIEQTGNVLVRDLWKHFKDLTG